jgi:hypothetical protein
MAPKEYFMLTLECGTIASKAESQRLPPSEFRARINRALDQDVRCGNCGRTTNAKGSAVFGTRYEFQLRCPMCGTSWGGLGPVNATTPSTLQQTSEPHRLGAQLYWLLRAAGIGFVAIFVGAQTADYAESVESRFWKVILYVLSFGMLCFPLLGGLANRREYWGGWLVALASGFMLYQALLSVYTQYGWVPTGIAGIICLGLAILAWRS